MALSASDSDVDCSFQPNDVIRWSGASWRVVAVDGRFLDVERYRDRRAICETGDELMIDTALLDQNPTARLLSSAKLYSLSSMKTHQSNMKLNASCGSF
ncbi:hypothetical protein [Halococcus sp. IIIV-5B]|uniref:hypothetical protein n=1 Tax=Halococcus sp. IIIV-5B TaxID=2321230 RepID=UPI0011C37905|nr:hypothetical protein [Halococcus sp. IIIV-5B]